MVAAVVVTHSVDAAVLDRCVRALVHDDAVDRVAVVDTGGGAELAADVVQGADVLRVENRGFGAAANVGFAWARERGATHVALLNDDAVARPGWLPPLLAELSGDVGAAQPALVGADGHVTSLGVQLDRYGAGHDVGDGTPYDPSAEPGDLEIFTGGAVVFSDEFLRATGGFDERFFLYYEDVDLARRGAGLGWRYRLVPAAVVQHDRGTTTGTMVERTRWLQERNRLWCAVRHEPLATIGRAWWLSIRRLRHAPRDVHRRALVAGMAGAPRRFAERVRRVRRVSA